MTTTATALRPTASQYASATMHLERRADWRTVRIDGTRYIVISSGTSGHVYLVRADAAGCECRFYERTGKTCSHMLALELTALETELTEAQPAPAPKPLSRYERLFPKCKSCDDLADTRDGFCDRCASDREWQARRDQHAAS